MPIELSATSAPVVPVSPSKRAKQDLQEVNMASVRAAVKSVLKFAKLTDKAFAPTKG